MALSTGRVTQWFPMDLIIVPGISNEPYALESNRLLCVRLLLIASAHRHCWISCSKCFARKQPIHGMSMVSISQQNVVAIASHHRTDLPFIPAALYPNSGCLGAVSWTVQKFNIKKPTELVVTYTPSLLVRILKICSRLVFFIGSVLGTSSSSSSRPYYVLRTPEASFLCHYESPTTYIKT